MYDLLILLGLITLGYLSGTIVEKRHFKRIIAREKAFLSLPAITLKTVDYPDQQVASARLVTGSAVISIDYFKKFLAGLRKIFGGTIKSYESLLDRARREAIVRMKEAAGDADIIVNLRIETSSIGKQANKKGVGCVEAIAYGTAIKLRRVT